MKKFNIFGVLLLIMTILTACGSGSTSSSQVSSNGESSADKKYVLKVVHAYPPTSSPEIFFKWYNEELQKRSNGRLSLEVYPNGQLMPANQEIPSILNGEVDMTLSSSGVLTSFDPIYHLFELPFLFDHDPNDISVFTKDIRTFFNSEEGGGMIASRMEEKGIKILSNVLATEPAILFTNSTEDLITDLESIKGLKIRIIGGKIVPHLFSTIGASGVSISAAELAPALQQGVVDGALTPATYAFDTKLPVKSATFLPLTAFSNPILISKTKFESLPPDLQKILVDVGKDMEKYSDEFMKERYPKVLNELKSTGVQVHVPTQNELEEWKKSTMPVWTKFAETVEGGQEFIDSIQAK